MDSDTSLRSDPGDATLPPRDEPALRLAFELNLRPAWIVDLSTRRVLLANEAAALACGRSRDGLREVRLDDVLADPEDAERLLAGSDAVTLATVRADGVNRPFEFVAHATTFAGRAAVLLFGDEATLETLSSADFGAIFDATGVGQVASDPDTRRFLRVNRKYCDITGYSADELLSMTFDDITHPDDRSARGSDFDRFVRGEAADYTIEKRYVRKDGEVVWVRVTSTLVRDASGRPRAAVAVVEDVTERKRAETSLRESEAMLAAAQSLAHVGTWQLDLVDLEDVRSNRLRWTDETFRIFGYEPGAVEVTNELFLQAVHSDDRDAVVAAILTALETRTTYEIEHRIVLPDGTERTVHEWGSVVADADGRPLQLTGSSQDITERTETERALRVAEERLRQAQKMEAVGRLAGGVAHDFNNLLTAILGYSDFLGARPLDSAARDDVEEIRKAAKRAAALTQQLLAFSRKQILKTEVLDLGDVLSGLGGMLGRLLGEDVEVSIRLGHDLGCVSADRAQLEQVVVNLAVNGRDAMPRGGTLVLETADVELDEAYGREHVDVPVGRYVMLRVSDTGAGMDRETQRRIFEPFFTTKEMGKGTGLGLATVYGIVKQLGGHIWVYSEVGHGTTFKIYFPRVDGPADTGAVSYPAAAPAGAGETVLLVEDEDSVRSIARATLGRYGYHVLEARDGDEALGLSDAFDHTIDLVVTDVVMPRMSGRELVERLDRRRPGIRVLYMSGYTEDAVLRHGARSHGIALLEKPFTPAELARRVRQAIDTPERTPEP